MSFGGGPSLGGGLMVSGSGGGASSPTGYADPLAPPLSCSGDPGGGDPGGSCTADGSGGGLGSSSSGSSNPFMPLMAGTGGASGGSSSCGCSSGNGGGDGGGGGAFSGGGPWSGSDGSLQLLGIPGGSQGGFKWWNSFGLVPPPLVLVPLDLGGTSCAPPPDPGTSPDPVPGPGSSHNIMLLVSDTTLGYPAARVVGLSVTCEETGVTLTPSCDPATFYMNDAGTYHFTTPGGQGSRCPLDSPPPGPFDYSGGGGSGSQDSQVTIDVQH